MCLEIRVSGSAETLPETKNDARRGTLTNRMKYNYLIIPVDQDYQAKSISGQRRWMGMASDLARQIYNENEALEYFDVLVVEIIEIDEDQNQLETILKKNPVRFSARTNYFYPLGGLKFKGIESANWNSFVNMFESLRII